MVIVVTEKHQNQLFIQAKPFFRSFNLVTPLLFEKDFRFDVKLTSVTIIKQDFLHKLFCYESLVDIEVSKH